MVLVNSLPDYLLDYRALPVLFPPPRSRVLLNLAAPPKWRKVPAGAESQEEPGSRVSVPLEEGFFPSQAMPDFLRALHEGGRADLGTIPLNPVCCWLSSIYPLKLSLCYPIFDYNLHLKLCPAIETPFLWKRFVTLSVPSEKEISE